MSAPKRPVPALRRQREKRRHDRAFVVIDGRKIACGRWGTPEAQQRYDRLIAEWLASGRRRPVAGNQQVTVAVLVDRFLAHAEQHYVRPDGAPTSKQDEFRAVVRPLLALYADDPAEAFDALKLRAVRQQMLGGTLARTTINSRIRLIRQIFKWGASFKLVPARIVTELATVSGLQANRTTARETEPIRPVADAMVDATLAHLTPTVQAMIETQRLTGMRPGELCAMTTGDIDTGGTVWVYTLRQHKTAHRGRERHIYLGPKAQQVLRPWLKTDLAAPIFSPRQSERERLEALHDQRKTPLSCGNRPGSNRKASPRRAAGERWTPMSYARAITRACDEAFPPPEHLQRQRVPSEGRKSERQETAGEWRHRLKQQGLLGELVAWQKAHRWTPNQLRHTYATRVRREFGLEAAQVLLGHSQANTTQIYAETDQRKAIEVARQMG